MSTMKLIVPILLLALGAGACGAANVTHKPLNDVAPLTSHYLPPGAVQLNPKAK